LNAGVCEDCQELVEWAARTINVSKITTNAKISPLVRAFTSLDCTGEPYQEAEIGLATSDHTLQEQKAWRVSNTGNEK